MSALALPHTAIPGKTTKASHRAKEKLPWGNPIVYFFALLLAAICLGPVLYIIFGGFNTNAGLIRSPSSLPWPLQWRNYTRILSSPNFWQPAWVSVQAAVITTAGVVVLGSCAAYALARYTFKIRGLLYSLFAAGLMFPLSVAIMPLFTILNQIKLLDTMAGLILPGIAFALPTTIIILVPFLQTIPKELEEAALLDGLGRLGFFVRVVLPLSAPGLITVAVLAFVGSWNGYILPLFVFGTHTPTLPLASTLMTSAQYSTNTAMLLAYTSMSMLPAIIFFSFFQRHIVGGLTGAVKG